MNYAHLLVFCLFGFLMVPTGYPQNKSERLGGHVFNLLGQPIFGAQVQVEMIGMTETEKTYTRKDGSYSFKSIHQGRFVIIVKSRGFREGRIESSYYGDSEIKSFNFGLQVGSLGDYTAAVIKGTIFAGEKPIQGENVEIINAFNYDVRESGISDKAGQFTIVIHDPGKYIIYAAGIKSTICAKGLLIEPGFKKKELELILKCD